jgi:ribosome biogenesis GTPase
MAKRARRSTRRRGEAGGAKEALPALSSLTDLPTLDELRPSERQLSEFASERERLAREEGVDRDEVELACVVRLDRGFPAVLGERGVSRCEFSAALTKGSDNSNVAVGDWVVARHPAGHGMGLLCKILARESDIARWKGGSRGQRQTLAANVETVLVAQALGPREVFFERVVRSAVIARDCGAEVAVVLTKADRVGEAELARDIDLIREAIGDGVRVVVTASVREGDVDIDALAAVAERHGALWGEDGVRAVVPRGQTAIVLGESGAGKSTLLNALLGHEALETGAVRESDDAGRHTTVARRMVSLPGAGVIVDAPGLRSLPLVGHERGLAKVFPEIAEAARDCKFRDCTHTHEPGCEVRGRFEAGEYSEIRFDAYVSLAAEMRESADSLDPDIVL